MIIFTHLNKLEKKEIKIKRKESWIESKYPSNMKTI